MSISFPKPVNMLTYMAGAIKLKTLGWKDYPGLLDGPNVITEET